MIFSYFRFTCCMVRHKDVQFYYYIFIMKKKHQGISNHWINLNFIPDKKHNNLAPTVSKLLQSKYWYVFLLEFENNTPHVLPIIIISRVKCYRAHECLMITIHKKSASIWCNFKFAFYTIFVFFSVVTSFMISLDDA